MSAFSGNIRKVLVIIAMEAEAAPLLAHLGLAEVAMEAANAPCKLHTGMVDGLSVSVVTNGKCSVHGVDLVGTSPAALTTFLAVNQVQPDLIINAGTAGGFKAKGAAIGDAFVSTNVRHHDRRIPIPGFTEYGIGSHVSTKCPNLVEALRLKTGTVTTGNSLDHTPTCDQMMAANDASVKDMEAASIAWAAELSGTPYFCVKVVTDIVDGDKPTQDEFLENLGTAAKSLQSTMPKVISFVAGKSLNDL